MIHRTARSVALAFALLALPAGLRAQQAPPAAADAQQQQLQSMVAELQQIHAQLQELQQRALQDPQLSAAQESLGASIRAAMTKADPTLETSMERVESLEGQFEAAAKAGDEAKQQAIRAEAARIQRQFMETQQSVLQQPEISAQMQAFQGKLESKMVELEPNVQGLITRFRTLEQQLTAAMQPAGPGN